jgi:hypothetical protein
VIEIERVQAEPDPLSEFCREVGRFGPRRQHVELALPLVREEAGGQLVTAAGLSVPQPGYPAPRRHPSILPYARRAPVSSGSAYEYTISDAPGFADDVAEGALKADLNPGLQPATARLRGLAAYIRISRAAFEDGSEALIRGLLQEALDRGLERRIFREVAAVAAEAGSGATLTLEMLQAGLAAVAGPGYLPTAIMVTADHRYTLPPGTTREGSFYDVALVVTPAGSSGDTAAIVGDWQACIVAQRGTANVEAAYMDADNMTRNMVTLRIESELAVAITAPAAFASLEATG